jgi:hypothetical protein
LSLVLFFRLFGVSGKSFGEVHESKEGDEKEVPEKGVSLQLQFELLRTPVLCRQRRGDHGRQQPEFGNFFRNLRTKSHQGHKDRKEEFCQKLHSAPFCSFRPREAAKLRKSLLRYVSVNRGAVKDVAYEFLCPFLTEVPA